MMSAGRGAPNMTDEQLSWEVIRTHIENSGALLRKLRKLDLASIATNELTTYLERNYLQSKLFDPERIERSLNSQAVEAEPLRVAVTLAKW